MFVYETVCQMTKMLKNLERWMDKAEAHAKARNFEPGNFLTARLAPDMYPFVRQVQSACDNAKFAAARLSGKEPPKHPDTEQTWDEIRQRVRTVLAHLETYKESDFNGGETRAIELAFMPGKVIDGSHYVVDMATPNFYFHVTMAYAILRHNGVDVGKYDYIGNSRTREK